MNRFFAGIISSCLMLFPAFFSPSLQGADKSNTVILVHGAFADGSSWNKVIPILLTQGFKVVAVQNPSTSLADDAATVKRAIDNQSGSIVLVGHSWGGAVITEAGNSPKVKSLVYVAAFAPGDGQSVFDISKDCPITPGLANLLTDEQGFATLPPETVAQDFAQDLPLSETQVMAVTQKPIAMQCFTDKVSVAAWKSKSNWFVVAEHDRMIQPALQKQLAERINASTVILPAGHVPMLSMPEEVASVINSRPTRLFTKAST